MTEEEKQAKKYICNKCGRSCEIEISTAGDKSFFGLLETVVRGEYGSPVLSDGTAYKFTICEQCLQEFFNSCVISPEESNYDLLTGEVYGR